MAWNRERISTAIQGVIGFTVFFTALFGIFGLPYFGAAVGSMLALHLISQDIRNGKL